MNKSKFQSKAAIASSFIAILIFSACPFVQKVVAQELPSFDVNVSIPDASDQSELRKFTLADIDSNVTYLVITHGANSLVDMVVVPASRKVQLPYKGTNSESFLIAGFSSSIKIGQRAITVYKDGRVNPGSMQGSTTAGGNGSNKEAAKLGLSVIDKDKQLTEPKRGLTLTSNTGAWPDGSEIIRLRTTVGNDAYETTYKLQKEKNSDKYLDQQNIEVKLHRGTNSVVATLLKSDKTTPVDGFTNKIEIDCIAACWENPPTARAVIGLEQLGASSADSKQSPFLDLYFDSPIGKKGFSIWSSIRFSNIPVQTLTGLGVSSFQSSLQPGSKFPNEFAQSFDFMVGLEKKLSIPGKLGNGFLPGKTEFSLIAGAGAINPLSSEKTAQIFKVPTGNSKFDELFPDAKTKSNIAFVSQDRNRFYRQYFGGFRLKTYFYDDSEHLRTDLFPAMVDITAGQSEAVTGTLRGVVLKVDGSTPLPVKDGILSVFGGVQMRFGRNGNSNLPLLFLDPADSSVKLTDASTFIVPFDKNPRTVSNRDTFRLGIGVDLFRLFKSERKDQ